MEQLLLNGFSACLNDINEVAFLVKILISLIAIELGCVAFVVFKVVKIRKRFY